MTIIIRRPIFAHPAVDFRKTDRSHPVGQAPSFMQLRRPAQSAAGQA